jgi:CheY-like chemotaxis protein
MVMDSGMPNINGSDAARRIEPWGRDLALVAMTGWGQLESCQRAAQAGIDCRLVKPIAIVSLRQALGAPTPSRGQGIAAVRCYETLSG